MAGSPIFTRRSGQHRSGCALFRCRSEIRGQDAASTVLPWVASWCSERNLQLRVHPWWPEDTAQHDEQPGDFAETPVGKLRDLVKDKDVFILEIIGRDMPGADIALIKFVWSARPGYDRRVRYVFLPRPGGDAEAVRSLFAELSRGAHLDGYRDPTPHRLEGDLKRWLGEGLSLDSRDRESATPSADPDQDRTPAAVVDENVQFTVYRPNAVQPEVWYPLLAFAHLAERRPMHRQGSLIRSSRFGAGGTGPRRRGGVRRAPRRRAWRGAAGGPTHICPLRGGRGLQPALTDLRMARGRASAELPTQGPPSHSGPCAARAAHGLSRGVHPRRHRSDIQGRHRRSRLRLLPSAQSPSSALAQPRPNRRNQS